MQGVKFMIFQYLFDKTLFFNFTLVKNIKLDF